MSRRLVACMILAVGASALGATEAAPEACSAAQAPPANHWAPSGFVENQGQWDARALFLARSAGAIVRLEADGLSLALEGSSDGAGAQRRAVLGLRFDGTSPDELPQGEEPLPGVVHHFTRGKNAPRKFDAMRFSSVTYRGLYPGIAIEVKTKNRSGGAAPLEYDILAEPGADLARVAIATEGLDELRVESDGSLILETPAGDVRQPAPVAWTESSPGERTPTPCRYRLLDGCRYGLEAPSWDGRSRLVIDPVVAWSRFLGGESEDYLFDAKVREADGTLIVCGSTRSMTFPELDEATYSGERNGGLDAVVLSFDASSGELRGAAVLAGEADDEAWSIALSPAGEVTVAGHTESPGFPVTTEIESPSGANGFVARFSADLADLEYSTLLGGSGEDRAANVVPGQEASVWVLGFTDSSDFPVTAGAYQEAGPRGRYDLFVIRLNPDGALPVNEQLLCSTYLGGSGNEPLDFGTFRDLHETLGLAADQEGRVYVAGRTDSRDFPTTPGARDRSYGDDFSKAFLSVLAPTLQGIQQLVYSTYLGGSSDSSSIADIVLDPSGSVWVTGWTFSPSFPTTVDANQRQLIAPAFGSNAFLARLVPDDSLPPAEQLAYSTFLAGANGALRCALDPSGSLTVTGGTRETLLPPSPAAPAATYSGGVDVFVTRLDPRLPPAGQHLFSTYIGGPLDERPQGLAVDSAGRAYVVGSSDSFEVQGVDGQSNGWVDGFIAVLDLRLPTAAFNVDGPHDGTVAVDGSASTTPEGTAIESYRWNFGDEATADGAVASHTYVPGRFTINLTVTNDLGLTSTRSQVVTISCPVAVVTPWTAADIGAPPFPGSAAKDAECFAVCAGGSWLSGRTDKLHLVGRETSGDFAWNLRIEEIEGAALGGHVGLMARETADPDSAMAAIGIARLPTSTVFRFNSRAVSGDSSALRNGGDASLPAWVRLERSGNDLIGSASPDGTTWTEVGRSTLESEAASLVAGVFGIGREPASGTFEALRGRACLVGEPVGPPRFRRGDVDSNGEIQITDAVRLLSHLFLGGAAPDCPDAADADDSGVLEITDAIFGLGYLFLGGPAPPDPGPEACGEDPTEDALASCSTDPVGCH